MEIPECVNKTGIPCIEIFQTKPGLSSNMNFKPGKYTNLSSDNPISAIKKDTTSMSATAVLSEGLTITTDAGISSSTPSNFTATSVFLCWFFNFHCNRNEPRCNDRFSFWKPKVKRKRIKYDTQFKAEVIQKKEGTPTSELIAIYKTFKLDKSKFQSGCK